MANHNIDGGSILSIVPQQGWVAQLAEPVVLCQQPAFQVQADCRDGLLAQAHRVYPSSSSLLVGSGYGPGTQPAPGPVNIGAEEDDSALFFPAGWCNVLGGHSSLCAQLAPESLRVNFQRPVLGKLQIAGSALRGLLR